MADQNHPLKFAINRNTLLNLLKQLKVSGVVNKASSPSCELTLTNNKATFVTSGVSTSMPIQFDGSAKISFVLNPFIKLIKTYDLEELTFTIHSNHLQVEYYKLPAQVTFIENDKILRSIDLPINYSSLDLLTIARDDRYTPEELEFNGLTPLIKKTNERLAELLIQTVKKLSEFGIERRDLERIIDEKIEKRLSNK